MTDKELRYMELIYRKASLIEIKNKLEQDSNNKAMMFLAKAMDENVENKHLGSIAMMQRWIDEISNEIKSLDDQVFHEFAESELESAKENYRNKNK